MKKLLVTFLLLTTFIVTGFAGNGKTNAFKGQVVDTNGSPIIGAKVIIKGINKAVYTDFDGEFIFPKVSTNSYIVKVSMVSFEESTSTIDFQSSNQESISITLETK